LPMLLLSNEMAKVIANKERNQEDLPQCKRQRWHDHASGIDLR